MYSCLTTRPALSLPSAGSPPRFVPVGTVRSTLHLTSSQVLILSSLSVACLCLLPCNPSSHPTQTGWVREDALPLALRFLKVLSSCEKESQLGERVSGFTGEKHSVLSSGLQRQPSSGAGGPRPAGEPGQTPSPDHPAFLFHIRIPTAGRKAHGR